LYQNPQNIPYFFFHKASEPLKKSEVEILAIGIGSQADRNELRLMTKRDEDVFITISFDDLLIKVGLFSQSACNSKCSTFSTS
jgi:hypothetical protein